MQKKNQQENKIETFSERVLRAALSIPEGRVTTYGRIARASGGGAFASQSITSILSKAEASLGYTQSIPFHRIVYADGRVWVNSKHYNERMELYKKEGIEIDSDNKVKNFQDILFEFE